MDVQNLFIGLLTAMVVLTIFETIQPVSALLVRRDLAEHVERKNKSDRRAFQRLKMYEAPIEGTRYGAVKRSKWQ